MLFKANRRTTATQLFSDRLADISCMMKCVYSKISESFYCSPFFGMPQPILLCGELFTVQNQQKKIAFEYAGWFLVTLKKTFRFRDEIIMAKIFDIN